MANRTQSGQQQRDTAQPTAQNGWSVLNLNRELPATPARSIDRRRGTQRMSSTVNRLVPGILT